MIELAAMFIAVPILCLVALSCFPSRYANNRVRLLRRFVPCVLAVQAVIAFAAVVFIATGGEPLSVSFIELSERYGIGSSVYIDGVSGLMLSMVSIVSFVASRFSIRYLDGEAMQGRYFRWLGFTSGAVSLMVIAGNLLLFFVAWVMTSFGLHQLLLHYRHRGAAHCAAWSKFTISRIGDAFLIAALILTFKNFGTFDMATLLQQAGELAGGTRLDASYVAAGWLIVLGAMTKSAQFPFHTWLPNTMETPTPVSALMHAGIVNAGGYLIIRTSPLVVLAPEALMALLVVGAFTACFAGTVMMTQTSVKRSLAYSTIAQMGFMMLQCGLGAFSIAMLHILAHSFYKAHAFLSSGSVLSQSAAMSDSHASSAPNSMRPGTLLTAMAVSLFAFAAVSQGLGIDIAGKPGGLVLAFIVCLALTTWGTRLFAAGQRVTCVIAIASIVLLCFTYLVSYLGVNHLVAPAVAANSSTLMTEFLSVDVCLAFLALFLLNVVLMRKLRPSWLESLRIHAANGFYLDEIYRRAFGRIANS